MTDENVPYNEPIDADTEALLNDEEFMTSTLGELGIAPELTKEQIQAQADARQAALEYPSAIRYVEVIQQLDAVKIGVSKLVAASELHLASVWNQVVLANDEPAQQTLVNGGAPDYLGEASRQFRQAFLNLSHAIVYGTLVKE